MKLTLIKEEIQDKNIVDEVMETHLYEDEQEKKAKEEEGTEVVNDEVVDDEQPESDAVQDILDPEETTGFDIPDEPLPLEGENEPNEVETNTDNGFPIEPSEPESPMEPVNNDEVQGMENLNVLNGLISNLWGIIDQLKWIKNNNRMVKDEKNGGAIPVQRYGDFRESKVSEAFGRFSPCFRGGTRFADLRPVLGETLSRAFEEGMEQFGQKLPGFSDPDTVLAGVESRTSSPVRIPRGEDLTGSVPGVYPCGEGAGYAGGITSAAMDGLRCAEALIRRFAPCPGA